MTLLEKLEAATGGSRELDAAIYKTLFFDDYAEFGLAVEAPEIFDRQRGAWVNLPNWSTSIDAALALVERRHSPMPHIKLELVAMDLVTGEQCYWTTCELQLPEDDAPYKSRHEYEPAIAICIALVKAEGE